MNYYLSSPRKTYSLYFVGETVEGEIVCVEPERPMSQLRAELYAKNILRELGGGHLDAFNNDNDDFLFDVEV